MKYYVRTVIGVGILTFAIVAFCYSLYQLFGIGTCASGGPYVSARECPDEIWKVIVGLVAGIFIALLGAAIWAARGKPPGTDGSAGKSAISAGIFAWSGLFLGGGLTALWAVVNPDATPGPGAETGAIIVAVIFIPMGAIPLIGSLIAMARSAAKRLRGSGVGAGLGAQQDSAGSAGLGTSSGMSTSTASSSPGSTVTDTANAVFGKSDDSSSPWKTSPAGAMGVTPPGPSTSFSGLGGAVMGAPTADAAARLQRLADLRSQGVLSDSEFDAAKAKIISGL